MAYEPLSNDLLAKIIEITLGAESGNRDYDERGRPVRSPKGALYAMQTMPATARDPGFGVKPARDNSPAEFNRVGRDYIKAMYDRYGSPDKAWAAYNAGPGRVDRALKTSNWRANLPGETRKYVSANMARLGQGMEPDEDEVDVATEDYPMAGGGALAAAGGGADYTSQFLELQRDLMSVQERQRQMRQQQLAEATQLLRERRLGPSRSEQLMQLSAAMLQPRRYKGFGATMSNVLPVLAQQQAQSRENETARQDALLKLQQQYQNADMEGEAATIKNRIDLLKILQQSNKPQWARTVNPETGEITVTPVYRDSAPASLPAPRNKAEYDALPSGARYRAPDGTSRRKP